MSKKRKEKEIKMRNNKSIIKKSLLSLAAATCLSQVGYAVAEKLECDGEMLVHTDDINVLKMHIRVHLHDKGTLYESMVMHGHELENDTLTLAPSFSTTVMSETQEVKLTNGLKVNRNFAFALGESTFQGVAQMNEGNDTLMFTGYATYEDADESYLQNMSGQFKCWSHSHQTQENSYEEYSEQEESSEEIEY